MGVRGLTTFIAKDSRKYLKPYKLHDQHLVIDGNSLCAQLYQKYANCNDIFGGDYDKFAKCIEKFFAMLRQCNITPIVIFDGGYEKRKLKTVNGRLQVKFQHIRLAHPMSSNSSLFPLFVRELLKDVLKRLGVMVLRCNYEGDFDIACLARKLNCPVLSYDSDFYVYDVLYIPFVTVDFYTTKFENDGKTKHCICCRIYKIENFLQQFGGLDKESVPLMATLLGNDYIRRSNFNKFYEQLKLQTKRRADERSDQQRIIRTIIEWLRTETFQSAVKKVLGRMKKNNRRAVAKQIVDVTQGYLCTDSDLFQYLGLDADNKPQRIAIDLNGIESEGSEDDEDNDDDDDDDDDEDDDSSLDDGDSEASERDLDGDEVKETIKTVTEEKFDFANYPWFEKMCRKGDFPTLFIDILTLKTAIFQPQIENWMAVHCIHIIIPFLRAFCRILNENQTHFNFLGRNTRSKVKIYRITPCNMELPNLRQLEHLNMEICRKTVLDVMNLKDSDMQYLSLFPDNWKLYFMSIIYWGRNSPSTINSCHLYSVLLCLLNLNVVDNIAGYLRSKLAFTNKYHLKLNALLADKTRSYQIINHSDYCKPVQWFIKAITINDCYFFIDNFISNFDMNEKLKSNRKLFCVDIVDAFSQFQTCLLHIKYLNALFKSPFPDFDISKFFNGTFLYNVFANIEKRVDLDLYMFSVLRNAPNILNCFTYITFIMKELLNLMKSNNAKRRKRKRKRTRSECENVQNTDVQVMSESNDSDDGYDANNRFSILRKRVD